MAVGLRALLRVLSRIRVRIHRHHGLGQQPVTLAQLDLQSMALFFPDPSRPPYRAVVIVQVRWSDGSQSRGSGTLVGSNDVLTAAHVVYAPNKVAQDVDIFLARDGGDGPFDSFTSGTWTTNYYPVGNANGTITQRGSSYDLALIGLSDNLGDRVGWLTMQSYAPADWVEVVGFPAAQGTRLTADTGNAIFRNGTYDISSIYHAPGSSGGPLLNAAHAVIGVVSSTLHAARIDDEWSNLAAWMISNDTLLPATATIASPFLHGTAADDRLMASSGADTIFGHAGADTLNGNDGDDCLDGGDDEDVLSGDAGHDTLIGGEGLDRAVFDAPRHSVIVTLAGATSSVRLLGSGDIDQLQSVERLEFLDGSLALDLAGHAGQVYRLYQAAFSRAPDVAGLKFQTQALDSGMLLNQLAGQFLASPEFLSRYGAPGTVSDAEFVTMLYTNTLHRAPEQAGYEYHLNSLAHGASPADLLIQFSESPENQVFMRPAIQNGIWLG